MNKKLLLTIGALVSATSPIAVVVSCEGNNNKGPDKDKDTDNNNNDDNGNNNEDNGDQNHGDEEKKHTVKEGNTSLVYAESRIDIYTKVSDLGQITDNGNHIRVKSSSARAVAGKIVNLIKKLPTDFISDASDVHVHVEGYEYFEIELAHAIENYIYDVQTNADQAEKDFWIAEATNLLIRAFLDARIYKTTEAVTKAKAELLEVYGKMMELKGEGSLETKVQISLLSPKPNTEVWKLRGWHFKDPVLPTGSDPEITISQRASGSVDQVGVFLSYVIRHSNPGVKQRVVTYIYKADGKTYLYEQ